MYLPGRFCAGQKVGYKMQKIYPFIIELNKRSDGKFTTDDLKYNGKSTISGAKKIFKKLIKITGLDVGEITFFNENCTIKFWYEYNGEKYNKRTW